MNIRPALLIVTFLLTFAGNCLSFELNPYQKRYLENQVMLSVDNVLSSLAEENYEVLYGFGSERTRKELSLDEFAKRMNLNKWKLKKSETKLDKIEIVEFTYSLVHFDFTFVRKVNPNKKVKVKVVIQTFYQEKEGKGAWRFDLFEIMRLPLKV